MGIPLIQVCYVRLGTQDVEQGARFAADILGLERVPTDDGEAPFRSDDLLHRLCLTKGLPGEQSVGLELPDESCVASAKAALEERGFAVREATADECKRRFVRQALFTADGSGNAIELVIRPACSGRRYFPSRDAGITGLQGVGLRSTDITRDLEFWTCVFDAAISDRVGDVTYLRIDSRHHRVALYPSERRGILYISLDVESLDSVMQSNYFLRDRQIKIVHGPGKETASGQVFVRFQGPEGNLFSFVHGMRDIDAKWRPRQFSPQRESVCAWGSEPAEVPELDLGRHTDTAHKQAGRPT
ncbi:VOC family protein [Bradyrhizobium sp. RDT10]